MVLPMTRAGQTRSQVFAADALHIRERRVRCACPVRPVRAAVKPSRLGSFQAGELARVAPVRDSELILMKIDMFSDLAFLRGRSWDRTSDPSLVRRKQEQNRASSQSQSGRLSCRYSAG